MKVTLEGADYEIDLVKAESLGLAKKIKKLITDLRAGDLFETKTKGRIMVVESTFSGCMDEPLFNIAGLHGLEVYSDFRSPVTKQKIINYVNDREYKYLRNINSEITELIQA